MTLTSTSNVTITVSPSPGFCIKSKLLQPGILNVSSTDQPTRTPVPIAQGLKVFVNIAWSKDVPPPLDDIEKALETVVHNHRMDRKSENDDRIFVFASDGWLDVDRAGKPALVFDCIYNSSLKHHAQKDAEFRKFLIECALRQIETQHSISLSRTLGTPNITSKGVLKRREVSVPVSLFPLGHHHRSSADDESPRKKLIEEVTNTPTISSGVDGPIKPASGRIRPDDAVTSHSNSAGETPTWTWSQQGGEIRITVRVPKLTRATITSAVLDLEPRRVTLVISGLYVLDINLELPDAAIEQASFGARADPRGAENALTLKRARDLDVDRARAEWRVSVGCLVIVA